MTVWDLMIGQPHAVRELKRAAEEGRAIVEDNTPDAASRSGRGSLSHAWLITGPPGSGRSTAAVSLAAALQCTGEAVGCGVCPGCESTLHGTNTDVQQHATDKRIIPIDDAREWVDSSYQAPSGERWRVTIVEDADRIEDRSAGALLKAVEEPPERGVWVLCAPTVDEVLPTIRSRCRHVNLRTPPADDVAQYLTEAEGVPFERAREAAVLAQSHVGVARALLKNPGLRQERVELMTALIRPTSVGEAVVAAGRLHTRALEQAKANTEAIDRKEKNELMRALGVEEGKRIPPALRSQIRELEENQKRRSKRALHDVLDRIFTDMLGFYRDVLTVQLGSRIEFVNIDLSELVHQIASQSTPEVTLIRTKAIDEARVNLQTNSAPLLVLESTAITLAAPGD